MPEAVDRETAGLIQDCELRIYEGKNHFGTIGDPRLPRDSLGFAARAVVAATSGGGRDE